MNAISKFLKDEDGITAIEYGILAALVAAALVATFSGRLTELFGTIFDKLTTAVTGA